MLKWLYSTIRKWTINDAHKKLYKKIANCNLDVYNTNTSKEGETLWKKKWSVLDSNISPLSYRIFSEYIGEDINILPCEVCATYIEPILNPIEYRAIYSDKNAFDQLFGIENTCGTILRRINGKYYDSNYNIIENIAESIFLAHTCLTARLPSQEGAGCARLGDASGAFLTSAPLLPCLCT